ncbi:MAG: hypothetical protein HND40_06610 [Ignavibacteriota bacterium]|jgi:hypothetical protein|nr:hypothetical protein [Ignavibacteriota bacterium]MCO6446230.1 hypothetical protein [Ignavibacterium album]MDT3696779.1 hypothetical protein [Ignavibacterium sp.]MEB2297409.1 hypothetical protein [Ignavibacteria bacterium]HOJ07238.1 hypothetical protein [Ignavibacteriaceae bacterium]
MLFDNLTEIKSAGFFGFEEIQSLMNNNCTNVPERKGIYFVLTDELNPEFLSQSVGGHFKGKNPTVSVPDLQSKWVEKTLVVYIGQAGGGASDATLKKRLRQFMKFGQGQPVGHWGGRLIWQLKNNRKLKICWKTLITEDPREVEKNLIQQFENHYYKKPFANIAG